MATQTKIDIMTPEMLAAQCSWTRSDLTWVRRLDPSPRCDLLRGPDRLMGWMRLGHPSQQVNRIAPVAMW